MLPAEVTPRGPIPRAHRSPQRLGHAGDALPVGGGLVLGADITAVLNHSGTL